MTSKNLEKEKNAMLQKCGLSDVPLRDCNIKYYHAGEPVLYQGHPLESIFIILHGTVKVSTQAESGKELTLCYHKPGDILGDIGFMMGSSTATSMVFAVSDTACIAIPLSENTEALKNCIPFLNYIGKLLAEKLLNRGEAQTATALAPAKIRLCAYILQMEKNGFFREPLVETAQVLGISYRHIFRLIRRLCDDHVLLHTGSGYQILQYYALQKCAAQIP